MSSSTHQPPNTNVVPESVPQISLSSPTVAITSTGAFSPEDPEHSMDQIQPIQSSSLSRRQPQLTSTLSHHPATTAHNRQTSLVNPTTSPPVDSSPAPPVPMDNSQQNQANNPERPRVFRFAWSSHRFCFPFLAIGLFAMTVTFTAFQWNKAETKSSKHECEIQKLRIEKDDKSTTNAYRVCANVTNIKDLNEPKVPLTACYGPDSSYNFDSLDEAERAKKGIQPPKVPCWVAVTQNVSLAETASPSPSYLTWMATVLTAVLGLFLLTILSSRAHDRLLAMTETRQASLMNLRNLGQPTNAAGSRRNDCLSNRQARFVCNVFGEEWRGGGDTDENEKDWICSVCLEESPTDTTTTIRTVVLPCKHRFHRRCIRQWLRKGKPMCPLCQWDSRELFDESGEPKTQVVDRTSVDDAGEVQCVAIVGEGEENTEQSGGGVTLSTTSGARYCEGLATWHFLNDEDSMSSTRTAMPSSSATLG